MSRFNFSVDRTFYQGQWCVSLTVAEGIKVEWMRGTPFPGDAAKRLYPLDEAVRVRLWDTKAPANEEQSSGWMLLFSADHSAFERHARWGAPGTFELGR